MRLTSHGPQRITAVAITCTAILVPAAALAPADCSAAAGLPASAAGPGRPATAYVANNGSSTVTPVNTATNKAGKPIKVDPGPVAIAITPNGKTAYVANELSGTVTPIRTATNTALKPIKVGKSPWYIAITP